MCNLYQLKTDIFGWAKAHENFLDRVLSLPIGAAEGSANIDLTWKPQLYPDYRAPLVVRGEDGRDHAHFARWGMPSPQFALQGRKTDPGVTNIRNTASPHWRRWLGPKNRCLVPMDAFSEPDQVGGSKRPVWFRMADERPLAYFAGLHVADWTTTRKVKEGEINCDLYGFLTCDAHPLVAQFHTKATPVILTTAAECETWLTAPWDETKHLQRTLPDEALVIHEPTPTATM